MSTKVSDPAQLAAPDAEMGSPFQALSSQSWDDGGLAIGDPFLQLDGSNTRTNGGLGLGLHVVQKMLKAYGGTIEVGCTELTTTFTVVLTAAPDGAGTLST